MLCLLSFVCSMVVSAVDVVRSCREAGMSHFRPCHDSSQIYGHNIGYGSQ